METRDKILRIVPGTLNGLKEHEEWEPTMHDLVGSFCDTVAGQLVLSGTALVANLDMTLLRS